MSRASKCMDAYMKEVRRRKLLTAEEERDLARRYRDSRDPAARRKLAEANLAFVVKKAHQLSRPHIPLEDLVQEGNLGILRAIESYDPERGIRFLSYARYWVEAYMRRVLVRNHSIVPFGSSVLQHRMYFTFEALKRHRLRGTGRELGDEDIEALADFLGTSSKRLLEIAARLQNGDVSLDRTVDPNQSSPLVAMIPVEHRNPEDLFEQKEHQRRVRRALDEASATKLNERERLVLRRRLATDEPETLREVGESLGVSRERVRQIQCAVVKKLTEPMHVAVTGQPMAAAV
jgi:RNA polymerase sigma-32 factor